MTPAIRSFINAVPTLAALLAALALLPWLMGIPGVGGSNFALGWTIGLYAILIYLCVFAALRLLLFLTRMAWFNTFPPSVPGVLMWSAFALFVLAQCVAWWLILKAG